MTSNPQKKTTQQELIIQNLHKSYQINKGEKLSVLEDISFSASHGTFIAFLGPSGCGKSSLLNIIAGFEGYDIGQVLFDNQPIHQPSPQRGMVFQKPGLFPWLTVEENISYGMKIQKYPPAELLKQEKSIIKLVELDGFEKYYPHQLSGGMQQRVALARILVLKPEMLLMDEPFASLDAQSRLKMQQLLISIRQKLRPTILFVTHDVEEALFLADKIYILKRLPGQIFTKIDVPFSNPRKLSLLSSANFTKMKQYILELIFSL
ncbi:MAG: ABC transporter ATP-binding protein [Clostridiales bacterium]